MRVADYIMHRLLKAGVTHVFQVTGRGSLFLSDALAKNSALKSVSLHHEQACAFAAVGYAEQTGGLGACLVSTGCASTNTITGVLSAWQDGIPCIFISGQNVLRETTRFTQIPIRTYGQQEADIVSIVASITKFSVMLTRAQDIVEVMDEALDAAISGRKGPVWIDVPLDLQSALITPPTVESIDVPENASPRAAYGKIEEIALDLKNAERPLVLVGKGVRSSGSEAELRRFVERLNIPLVYTAAAPDTYGSRNLLSIGSVGSMGCSRAANFAVQNSDYLLILGSRLTSLTTGNDYCKFARSARITVVDIDPIEHSKSGITIDNFVHSDLKPFLVELTNQPIGSVPSSWVERCLHWKSIFGQVEDTFNPSGPVDLYQLADRLGEFLQPGFSLVTDSGLAEVILPTNIRFNDNVRCIHPASQGVMGFALPAAIGAQFASNGSVLAVIGDGSIMMNLQELESIRHHKLPIKIIVINNHVYSIIRRRQRELFRGRTIGTDTSNGVSCPNFSVLANCFGFEYQRIESVVDLESGLERLFSHPGAVLCEMIGREDQGYIELGQARSSLDGRLVRRPLEDQAPFLPRELFLHEMIIEPIDQ